MNMKALRRVVLMVVALVASSLSLVTVSSAPASADTYNGAVDVRATVAVREGGTATVEAQVYFTAPDNEDYLVSAGTARLEQLAYGSSTWAAVSTQTITTSTNKLTWTVRPAKTTKYRVVYSGGTYTYPSETVVWTPATSAPVSVGVARNLHDKYKKRTKVFSGKVTSYGRKPVMIQKTTCATPKAATCKWTKFRTVKTNAKGAWSVKLPFKRTKTTFRAVVKPGAGYITSYSNWVISTQLR
ncbi:hypothetical protein ABFU82_06020 [Nocardioides sp. WV_118_6]|uniref:hypothetical protein n=2 Tax=Pimelobacter TaxID=2044 RepID=UPI00214FE516|nr:hypothetical protein [Pimelobacter simplex]UUW87966.1 hypothetical protein M0M43_19765 [Pimelobacter simplex]UUW97470.1 hypothetical protein M0M48_08410 [Pimelobacter simplex]